MIFGTIQRMDGKTTLKMDEKMTLKTLAGERTDYKMCKMNLPQKCFRISGMVHKVKSMESMLPPTPPSLIKR